MESPSTSGDNCGVFNIVSSNNFNLPSDFDDYAEYAEHLNHNPGLNTLYSTARNQCEELARSQIRSLGSLVLKCDDFLPGSQFSDGVYTLQFTTMYAIRKSELLSGENQRFMLGLG